MLVNIDPVNQEKKVCIIVPVYNAEKYLGYCLNSVLSQTYTNWTAILVDDGSTDSSLDICRNYEAIDSRFRVIIKPNGGVSSARNAGLAIAEGDYLEFLDSDDCLAHDALEKQIKLAAEYNSQLVMMDIMMVDFSHPEYERVMLSSAWLKQSPCLLSAEEFKAKRMQLIWFTVLLECLHGKLYDLSLWRKLDLAFPEDMSLGEDFVTNMKYFEACNNVVFLHECGHYYNCIVGSNSLTQKYRPDLFETKMYLMEKLEEHLGGRSNLSAPERDAFYCYAASSGLVCVEKTVLNSGMGKEQMMDCLQGMFAYPLFAESIRNATYIPERFAACIEFIKENQLDQVIWYIFNNEYVRSLQKAAEQNKAEIAVTDTESTAQSPQEADAMDNLQPNSGLLNRMIRKFMMLIRPLFGQSRMAERLTRWEGEIAQYGLKCTVRIHVDAHQRGTRGQLGKVIKELDGRLCEVSSRMDAQTAMLNRELNAGWRGVYNRLEEQHNALDTQLTEYAATLHVELNALEKTLCDKVNAQTASVDEKINASEALIQKNVNDYAWISEQRMTRYAYQRDINELRQRKKAIMLATAEHANIGDAAITLAEQQILSAQFPEYFQVEISTYEFNQKEAYLHAILNVEDILFIHGGGNVGDLYLVEEELHRKIVSEFPNNKIVIFPQTICFSDTENGALELQKSSRIYNSHKDLTLFVRGETSLEIARTHFAKVKTILMPDSVHVLRSNYGFERSGALLCLREDEESRLNDENKNSIASCARALTGSVDCHTNIHTEDVTRDIRGLVVRKELMCFARHQIVITDRLHGMIFAAVTGTPCVVLSSYNHKIREYYEVFFQDSNAVFFIGDDMDKLEGAVKEAMQVTDVHYPVFKRNCLGQISAFLVNGEEN